MNHGQFNLLTNLNRQIRLITGLFCGLLTALIFTWQAGQAAPLPSAPPVTSPVTLSNSTNHATRPVIVTNNANTLYVAWEQAGQTGGNADIFQSSNSGSGWTTPAAVYASTANSQRPTLAAGPNGDIHLAWKEENPATVYTTFYQKGVTPTTPISISPIITQATAQQIVADSNNTPHLVQQGNQSAVSQTPYSILHSQNGQASTFVYSPGSGFGASYPTVAADSQGNLHVAWQENTGPTNGVIYYSKGITSGGSILWQAAAPIPAHGVVITDAARPSMAIDGNDNLHLVWVDHLSRSEQYIYYSRSPALATDWITPTRIIAQSVGVNDASPSYVLPVVTVFSHTIYVAWHDKTNDSKGLEDIYYTISEDSGATWATPVNVSNSDGVQSLHPQITADSRGAIHFVWQECNAGNSTCPTAGSDLYQVQYARTLSEQTFLPVVIKNN